MSGSLFFVLLYHYIIYKVPADKSCGFAYKHPNHCRDESHAIEAERYGKHISDKWYPGQQCYWCAEAFDAPLLSFEALAAHSQLFYPLPPSGSAYGVACNSA